MTVELRYENDFRSQLLQLNNASQILCLIFVIPLATNSARSYIYFLHVIKNAKDSGSQLKCQQSESRQWWWVVQMHWLFQYMSKIHLSQRQGSPSNVGHKLTRKICSVMHYAEF
jgi:hypothetical protein